MQKLDFSMSVNELLQYWVENSYKTFSGGKSTPQVLEDRKELKSLLLKKGVSDIELFTVDTENYTIRYKLKGNLITKSVDVTKLQ